MSASFASRLRHLTRTKVMRDMIRRNTRVVQVRLDTRYAGAIFPSTTGEAVYWGAYGIRPEPDAMVAPTVRIIKVVMAGRATEG
jgi:hypothetical protein